MHYAGNIGNIFHRDAAEFGWQNVNNLKHDWSTMQKLIGDYIKSLNFSYKVSLRSANVTYLNALAHFIDPHTIEWKVIKRKSQNIESLSIFSLGSI
jgi:thioredoxin reductase (NADPH)